MSNGAHELPERDLGEAIPEADKAASRSAIARELQQELLNLHFDEVKHTEERLGFPLYTGNESIPLEHYRHVAEAYRLAGLLHRMPSFPNN